MPEEDKASTIFDLSLDIKYVVLDYLDNRSMANLALTCKYFGMLVRNIISFRKAEVRTIDHLMPKIPPFLNYRAGVAIGSTFYMPFINESPFCYTFDLNTGIWSSHKLNLIDMKDFQPQITSAAVIGTKIYLVGGRLLKSYTLSNGMIEIDITNFNTRIVKDADGMPPRPRHEHSVDVIGSRYLVVFGGLCYNSVGENDVFVYDTIDNRWFVPPISGHVPHLRFGHASAVIGNNMYIHGGAQLDSDSGYIVYDDLYRLDCKTWVWYKYEHPEVEKYLRNQMPTPGQQSTQRSHLISTTGDSPYDRFQSYMCSFGNKLITFGGHSIRQDEDDNELLCSYPIDELCVFNIKRRAWTTIHANTTKKISNQSDSEGEEEEEALTVSDMSVATMLMGSRGIRIYIFAGKKAAEIPRSFEHHNNDRSSVDSFKSRSQSSTSGSGYSQQGSLNQYNATHNLPSITESVSSEDGGNEDRTESGEILSGYQKSQSEETEQGAVRTPNETDHSDVVKAIFENEPDMDDTIMQDEEDFDSTSRRRSSNKGKYRANGWKKRPSISVIPNDHSTEEQSGSIGNGHKNTSSSSHSSISSTGSLGNRKSTHERKVIPCTIVLDLIE